MTNTDRSLLAQLSATQVDRRSLLRAAAIGAGVVTISPLLAACEVDDDDDVDDDDVAAPPEEDDEVTDDDDDDVEDVPDDVEGVFGGTLSIADEGAVSNIDIQAVGSDRMPAMHVFETPLTYDEVYEIVPLLAETWDWDDDGLGITLRFREDVLFHNGDSMVADDVVASIERYMEAGQRGLVGELIETVDEVDDSTVKIELARVFSGFVPMLASPLVNIAIHPREHIEGVPSMELTAVEDLIGTGPYAVEEFIPDERLDLVRFDDYYQTEGERDGNAGAKVAYFDRIEITGVPEGGTRISGLLAGDSDVALQIPFADVDRIDDGPDTEMVIGGPGTAMTVPFNHHEDAGWSANLAFRQAVQARVDHEEIANIAFGGDEDLYRLHPSIYRQDQEVWWTDAAADRWNQNDPERARELLDEAGYDGEEIVFLYITGSREGEAVVTVMTEQLEEIGINIRAEGVDTPTYFDRRDSPTGFHMVIDGMSVRLHPSDWDATWSCETFRVFWCNDEMQAAFDALQETLDPEEQQTYAEEIQRAHHEYVYGLWLYDSPDTFGIRSNLQGVTPWYIPRFWGVWFED